MHNHIAVAAAMERELNFLRLACAPTDKAKNKFFHGNIAGKTVYLVRTGIGPVKTVQRLTEMERLYKPQCIVSIGCAGALDPSLRIGDAVAPQFFYDDQDDGRCWESTPALVEKAISCCRKLDISCRTGGAVSTLEVAATPSQKRSLGEKYGALTVDMESAQVACWAAKANIPMMAIRTISDLASDTLDPRFSGLFDRNGKLQYSKVLRRFGASPSLLISSYRLKAKFDRSIFTLAKIMLPLLNEM